MVHAMLMTSCPIGGCWCWCWVENTRHALRDLTVELDGDRRHAIHSHLVAVHDKAQRYILYLVDDRSEQKSPQSWAAFVHAQVVSLHCTSVDPSVMSHSFI